MKIKTSLISFALLLSAGRINAQEKDTVPNVKKIYINQNRDFAERITWEEFQVSQGIRYPMESMPAYPIKKEESVNHKKQIEPIYIKTNKN